MKPVPTAKEVMMSIDATTSSMAPKVMSSCGEIRRRPSMGA